MDRRCTLLIAACLLGCPSVGDDDDATEAVEPKFGPEFIGGSRPAYVIAPADYDGITPTPVVFLLHGLGASGELVDLLFGYSERVDEDGFLLVIPEGTENNIGKAFWNARPHSDEEVDDVAYLTSLIDAMLDTWQVDPGRVYFAGHSNGGYMSYRMACEAADRITAVMPFAGLSPYLDEADCEPAEAISVLHVHGTEDGDVDYAPTDGRLGAEELSASWAARAGCDPAWSEGEPLDLVSGLPGAETAVRDWTEGCDGGTSTSLWSLQDAGHTPGFGASWAEETLGWLLEHRK